jgi:hypothetical protein
MGAPPFAPTRRAQPLCSEPPYLGAGVRDSLSPCTHGYSLCTSIHLTDHLGTYPGSAVLPPSPTALTAKVSFFGTAPRSQAHSVNHCPVSTTSVMHTPSSSTSVVLAGVACGSLLADRRSKGLSGLSYSADARHLHSSQSVTSSSKHRPTDGLSRPDALLCSLVHPTWLLGPPASSIFTLG